MTIKVLVVEDDIDVKEAIDFMLERMGCDVVSTGNGQDAVNIVSQSKKNEKPEFDIVLTDLLMPGKDGFDVLTHVKSIYPDIPVVVFTGNYSEENRNLAVERGASAFLAKPFDKQDICKTFEDALGKEVCDREIRVGFRKQKRTGSDGFLFQLPETDLVT